MGLKILHNPCSLRAKPILDRKTDMHNVARDGGRHRGVGVLPHHRVSRLSLGGWLVGFPAVRLCLYSTVSSCVSKLMAFEFKSFARD